MKKRGVRVREALQEAHISVEAARSYVQVWLYKGRRIHKIACPGSFLCEVCLAAFPSLKKEPSLATGTSTNVPCPCLVRNVKYVERVVRRLLKEIQ